MDGLRKGISKGRLQAEMAILANRNRCEWRGFWVQIQKSLALCNMGVSENRGTPKSAILIGFSIINHPFWGTPIFGNTNIVGFCLDGFFMMIS